MLAVVLYSMPYLAGESHRGADNEGHHLKTLTLLYGYSVVIRVGY